MHVGHVKYYLKCYHQCNNRLSCDRDCSCKKIDYSVIIDVKNTQGTVRLSSDAVTGVTVPHTIPVSKNCNVIDVCQVEKIKEMCITISIPGQPAGFIMRFPDFHEKD